jgi:redox-sensitive bicupin YhaK (pirin superfamily)
MQQSGLLFSITFKLMKATHFKANTRGMADYGWLKARYSFSFANYFNPERVHFGKLRVLNDDIIDAGMGFGTHPHDNMEIITIPLKGAIAHRDSMGNGSVIHAGEIQYMSAGSGVTHSEFNASETEEANLLQIWIFPDKKNSPPRYSQMKLDEQAMQGQFSLLVSPENQPGTISIHQQAWLSMGQFTEGSETSYALHSDQSGLFLFLIEGKITMGELTLGPRDAAAISSTSQIDLAIQEDARILLIEIPLN